MPLQQDSDSGYNGNLAAPAYDVGCTNDPEPLAGATAGQPEIRKTEQAWQHSQAKLRRHQMECAPRH